MSDFKIKVGTQLDSNTSSKIQAELNKIKNLSIQIKDIKVGNIDTSNITKSIQTAIQNAYKSSSIGNIQLPTVSEKSGTNILKTVSTYNEDFQNLSKLAKRIGSLEFKISGLDTTKNQTEIETLKKQLTDFKNEYSSILQSIGGNLPTEQWGKLQAVIDDADNKLTAFKSKMQDKISYDIDTKSYEAKIAQLTEGFKKTGLSASEAKTKVQAVREAYQKLQGASPDQLIKKNQELNAILSKTQNELKIAQVEAKEYTDTFKVVKLTNKIETWLNKNTAATKEAKQEMQLYLTELQSGNVVPTRFQEIQTRIDEINTDMRKAGKLGKSFGSSLSEITKKFSSLGLASSAMMKTIQSAKDMVQAVYDIDTAMTNLYKVTDETSARYNQFLTSASENAKELGRSVSSLIDQTANWSKLGFTLDQSEELAKVSSIYANVGEVDDETAVSDIVTAMKAFNMEAENSIDIVDKLNNLGNKYATSSADLGTGLSNSASALHLAGNTIDESLAMITAMSEITQDASESGNALKILSMRIRGYDEETESYSNDVEKLTGTVANLTKTASTPGGISLFTDDTKETYKSTYQLLNDISQIWDDLTDKNQAKLLEVLAGKQRGNSISALITNMSQANSALNDSINSSGSAYEEQERWMDSIEAKTQQFEASFQSLANTVLDSDLLKFFVDFGTGAVNAIEDIVDALGALPVAISAIYTVISTKNSGGLIRLISLINNSPFLATVKSNSDVYEFCM